MGISHGLVGGQWEVLGMAAKWRIEFYEDTQGRIPVEKWIDGLGDQKAEAVGMALKEVLGVSGIKLASGA